MSLINQALKKAQREQVGPTPVRVTSDTASTPRQPHLESRQGYRAVNFWISSILIVTSLFVAGAALVILLRPSAVPVVEEEAVHEATVHIRLPEPVAGTDAKARVVVPEETVEERPEATETQVSSPVAMTTAPAPATPVPTATAAPEAVEVSVAEPVLSGVAAGVAGQPVKIGSPAEEPPPPPLLEAPLPDAKPNPKVLAFLEASRITGVKIAGPHSRLLMNNQVYRTEDVVHQETTLRIKTIEPMEVIFVDESGIQYRKQFQR